MEQHSQSRVCSEQQDLGKTGGITSLRWSIPVQRLALWRFSVALKSKKLKFRVFGWIRSLEIVAGARLLVTLIFFEVQCQHLGHQSYFVHKLGRCVRVLLEPDI